MGKDAGSAFLALPQRDCCALDSAAVSFPSPLPCYRHAPSDSVPKTSLRGSHVNRICVDSIRVLAAAQRLASLLRRLQQNWAWRLHHCTQQVFNCKGLIRTGSARSFKNFEFFDPDHL